MGCTCNRHKGKSRHTPGGESCGCGENCGKNRLLVHAEDVFWNSGNVPEMGIHNGDTLEEIVRKIARTVKTMNNEQ